MSCQHGQRVAASASDLSLPKGERLAIAEPLPDELHVVYDLPDDPSLFAPAQPNSELLAYRAAVDERLHGGHGPYELLRRAMAIYSRFPAGAKPAANQRTVLSGVGAVGAMNRLELLLWEEQNRRFPMISRPTEFHALVLRGHGRVILYFGTTGMLFGKVRDEVMDRVRADVAKGFRLAADVHPHPFTFDRVPGDMMWTTADTVDAVGGGLAPSEADAQTYRELRETLGLESAWITNGFDSVHIPAADFGRFQAAQ